MTEPPSAEVLARRKLFTATLRSGRFRQGKGQLAIGTDNNREHCCLGVACEIAAENGLELRYREDNDGDRWYTVTGDPDDNEFVNHSCLPISVAQWYGWTSLEVDPQIPANYLGAGDDRPASEANDGGRMDFAQIADAFDNKYVLPFETPEDPGDLESRT